MAKEELLTIEGVVEEILPDGRFAVTRTSFYVLGSGYTAWQRFDHNRIELVPEKSRYRPGDTARIMIKSPWESATALLTTEREGVRSFCDSYHELLHCIETKLQRMDGGTSG